MIPKLQTVNLVAIFPNSNVFSMLEKGVAEVRSNTYSEGCVATGKGVTFTIVGKVQQLSTCVIVQTSLVGGGTIYSNRFVQTIFADRYIHRREM